jgi:hypothetical protein
VNFMKMCLSGEIAGTAWRARNVVLANVQGATGYLHGRSANLGPRSLIARPESADQ